MKKLVYLVATTIDGYIASAPSDNLDFFISDGPQAPDLLAEFPDMIPAHARPQVGMAVDTPNKRFDTVLMGRRTYEIGLAVGVASPYPHLKQIVVSDSLPDASHAGIGIWRGNVREHVQELKQTGGADIWLCGGGTLAASLFDEIDELILKGSPVVLGSGVPLIDGRIGPRRLIMTDHRIYDNGFALMRYQQARAV